jgi:hypothetical protein
MSRMLARGGTLSAAQFQPGLGWPYLTAAEAAADDDDVNEAKNDAIAAAAAAAAAPAATITAAAAKKLKKKRDAELAAKAEPTLVRFEPYSQLSTSAARQYRMFTHGLEPHAKRRKK